MKNYIFSEKFDLSSVRQAALSFLSKAKDYNVWAFIGDLGAGKTTFAYNICEALGVKDTVSSPTFSIINHYVYEQDGQTKNVFHSDWYRLNDEEEAIDAGVEDMIYTPNSLVIVEWYERAPNLIPAGSLMVEFDVISPTEREIKCWVKEI